MVADLLQPYLSSVLRYHVTQNSIVGESSVLVADIIFSDSSRLFIKDYTFLDGSRKYSFHYQDSTNILRFRYDNEAHHKQISTFPYHKHTPSGIVAARAITLPEVLDEIITYLSVPETPYSR